MSSATQSTEEEVVILENIAKWQAVQDPLTPLSDKYLDIIYKIEDKISEIYYNKGLSSPMPRRPSPIIDNLITYCQWYSKVENELSQQNLSEYLLYGEQLQSYNQLCKEICENTNDAIVSLSELQNKYKKVSFTTNTLHILSEQLLKEAIMLKGKKSVLDNNIHHFRALKLFKQQLQQYSSDVNSQQFVHTMERMYSSFEYFIEKRSFKEGPSYRYHFESLLSQAGEHVVRHFGEVISEVTAQAQESDAGGSQSVSSDNAASFYYGNFQNAAAKVANVLKHIEKKIANTSSTDIYIRALNDCHRIYFLHRTPIITAAVRKALHDLRTKHRTDQSLLFRSSGFFVMKVCEDEAICFHYFFTTPAIKLSDYLTTICEILYDVLRPRLISINHLEVLTGLCTTLKEMLSENDQNRDGMLQFVTVVRELLHDVEERLVFRANVYFQYDIRCYKPSPGDLAYPEKLDQMENVIEELATDMYNSRLNPPRAQELHKITNSAVIDFHGMWYPSVKRTLVCLSSLYLCLERKVFQGLAQEALLMCAENLEHAGKLVAARRPNDGPLHGNLFQIKHLLVLREQIAPFQVEFTARETGLHWAGLLSSGDRFIQQGSKNALLEFLMERTVPQVREYLVDSRKEIDLQLKRTCDTFITVATSIILSPLFQWMDEAEAVLSVAQSAHKPFKKDGNGQPRSIAAIVANSQRSIKIQVPIIQKILKTYLSNRETESILFRPIKNKILLAFLRVEQILTKAEYTKDECRVVACPSAEVLNVLISSVSLNTDINAGTSTSRAHSSNAPTSAAITKSTSD